MPEFDPYRSRAEIENVVRRFENCDYKPDEFFHARHLTVAAWYFEHFAANAAEERMRAGLQKFIRHHGQNGYHVTITEFWLRMAKYTLGRTAPGEEAVGRVNQVVGRLNDKNLIYEFYSRELLNKPEAKSGWHEPDLKRIPSAT